MKRQALSARAHAVLAAVVVLDGSGSWEEIRSKASVTDAQLVGTLFHLQKLGLIAIGEGRRVVRPCSWGVRYCGGRNQAQAFVDALTTAG